MNVKYRNWMINGLRFFSQLFFFIIFGNLTIILGFIYGFDNVGTSNIGVPVPVNQPIAAPYTTSFNLFELLQWEFANAIFPYLTIGSIFIYGVIFGRGYCGWVCPFGFIQDIVGWAPVKKRIPSRETNKTFGKIKFGFFYLAIFWTIWAGYIFATSGWDAKVDQFGSTGDLFSGPFSQSNTLLSLIPTAIIDAPFASVPGTIWDILLAFPWFFFRIVMLLIFLLAGAYITRFWCRYFCPTGAMTGFFNRIRLIYLGRDPAKCLGKKCKKCQDNCPMGIRILDDPYQRIKKPNCIMCFKCYNICDKGAIKLKFF